MGLATLNNGGVNCWSIQVILQNFVIHIICCMEWSFRTKSAAKDLLIVV